jgi:serine O-acetyltransferase
MKIVVSFILVLITSFGICFQRIRKCLKQNQAYMASDQIILPQRKFAPHIWEVLRKDAERLAKEDIRSSMVITNTVLVQDSFEESLVDCLAYQLESPLIKATQIRNIFFDVLTQNSSISHAWATDLLAAGIHDLSQPHLLNILMFNKGYHALSAYRIANTLWYSGRDSLARYFQSLISRTFDSDIHPACRIGSYCYFPTGSGIVLGETGSIGHGCSFSEGVTLGGTGKEIGDRHPKVGNHVFFGTGATVLGNILVGDGSVIDSSSVVTKPVAAYNRVGGVPAKVIKHLSPVVSNDLLFLSPHLTDPYEFMIFIDSELQHQERLGEGNNDALKLFCDRYLSDLTLLRNVSVMLPKSA